jgi:hypothetical protein
LTYRKSGSDQQPEVQILEGTKLTGDPNVPMKEVSFRAFLSQPLLYTSLEDQVNSFLRVIYDLASDTVFVNFKGKFIGDCWDVRLDYV